MYYKENEDGLADLNSKVIYVYGDPNIFLTQRLKLNLSKDIEILLRPDGDVELRYLIYRGNNIVVPANMELRMRYSIVYHHPEKCKG